MMHTKQKKMWVIGITGGVGTGKSEILHYLKENYNCLVLLADDMAKEMQKPGGSCYQALVNLMGLEIVQENRELNRKLMAQKIFQNATLREQVNDIIHPAVKEEVMRKIKEERAKGELQFIFIEAALLIESGFDKICDELWYIYTKEVIRAERLRRTRGYSDEKIKSLMNSQLSEADFRKACKVVIDNNGLLQDTVLQINQVLEGYTWQI